MDKIAELSTDELKQVVGGAIGYTRTDPKTGETVVYSDSGMEIGRYQSTADSRF